MRLLVDTLIALMLLGILAGMTWHYRGQRQRTRQVAAVQTALQQLHEQMIYHKALGDVTLSATGYPLRISPKWFGKQVPRNDLASARHPWMDTAKAGGAAINPADPVLSGQNQAAFWYNPGNGEIRARVPRELSDEATLALYNMVNRTTLTTLPDQKPAGKSVHVVKRDDRKTDAGATATDTTENGASHDEKGHRSPPRRPTLVNTR